MSTDFVVRPVADDDVPAVLALMRRCLGPGPWGERGRELWNWKHRENPFGPSPCLLAEAGGAVVGVRCFLRWRLRHGSSELSAVRAVDTATDANWRGRGVFRRLTVRLVERLEDEGVIAVFNTPNRASGPGYLSMGWRPLGRLPLRVRLARPWRRRPVGREGDVGELLSDAAAIDLWRTPACPDALTTDRTSDWLAWRYRDLPVVRYRALWGRRGDAAAAVVYRLRQRGPVREIRVAEVLATPGHEGERLAAGLLGQAAGSAGGHVLVATAGGPGDGALERAGFVRVGGLGPLVMLRPLAWRTDLPDPLRWPSWRWSLGDLELM